MSNVLITKQDIKKFVNLFKAGIKSKGFKEINIETRRVEEDSYDYKDEARDDTRYWVDLNFKFSISKGIADKIKEMSATDEEIDKELKALKNHE